MRGIGEAGQVQQDERELERPPRGHPGALLPHRLGRFGVAQAAGFP